MTSFNYNQAILEVVQTWVFQLTQFEPALNNIALHGIEKLIDTQISRKG